MTSQEMFNVTIFSELMLCYGIPGFDQQTPIVRGARIYTPSGIWSRYRLTASTVGKVKTEYRFKLLAAFRSVNVGEFYFCSFGSRQLVVDEMNGRASA